MTPTAVSSTADGGVLIAVDMDVSDAQKELARLKKDIIKLETDIKTKQNERGIFASKLEASKKEYTELQHKLREFEKLSDDEFAATPEVGKIAEKMQELDKYITAAESSIEKLDLEIDRSNIKLEGTKMTYGEIAQKAEQLRQTAEKVESTESEESKSLGELSKNAEEANKKLHELKDSYGEIVQKERELQSEVQQSSGKYLGGGEIDRQAEFIARQERIFDHLKSELRATRELTSEVTGAIREKLATALEPVYQRISPTLDRIKEKLSDVFRPLYEKLDLGEAKKSVEIGLDGIRNMFSYFASKLAPDLKYAAGSIQTGIKGIFSGLQGLPGKIGTAIGAVSPYVTVALKVAEKVIAVLKRVWAAAVKFASGFVNALKRGAEAVYSFSAAVAKNFVAALKAIGRFGKSAAKALSAITKKIISLAKRFNVFSKISDNLGEKIKRLGSTIKSAIVFSVIYKGLSMISQQMGAYLSVNEQFMTAVRRLQGVLLTAFQPIYQVVVPALTTLINVLTRAAATVTQFFASLFGTTAKRAQANAESLYNQATATTAAGEAAEEASKQLAAFDEINKLEGSKKAGGGGATSVDMGPLFDYEYDETPFDDWGKAFSGFLDKLLDGIPKLRKAFKDFADWLNNLSNKLYNMFTFPGVLDKVKELGKALSDAFDALLEWIDWDKLGRALGAGLNLAIQFLDSFIYGGDSESDSTWKRLGKHLSEAINGLVDEVEWYDFGRLLWGGFKIGLETLAGLLENLNMPALANAASDVIMGFFDEMRNTINRINWDTIGNQIATFLNEFRWYDAITSAFTAIAAGIMGLKDMVDAFLAKLDISDITDQISRAINDAIDLIDWEGVGNTIGAGFQTAFDFLKLLIGKINWYEIGQSIAEFILGFDFVRALGSLADLVAEGINAAIKTARGFLDKIMPEISGIAEGIAERLKNAVKSVHWDELGQVIGDAIQTALSFVAGLLDPELFYEIGKAIGEFFVNLDWPGIFAGLGEVLANAINSAVALVSGFLDVLEPNIEEIATGIANAINDFVEKTDWEKLGQTISRGIEAAIDFMITLLDEIDWDKVGDAIATLLENIEWETLLSKVGTALGKALDAVMRVIDLSAAAEIGWNIISGIAKGIKNKFDESGGIMGWLKRQFVLGIIDGVKSLFGIHSPSTVFAEIGENLIEGLKKGISDTWHAIPDFFSEKLTEIKKTLSDAWTDIQKTASEKWEAIKTTLSTAWGNIKTTAQTKFGEIKDKIIEKMEEVKNKDWFQTGKSIVDGILRGLESIWNSLTRWARDVKNTISNALSGASRSGSFSGGTGYGSGRSASYAMRNMADIPAISDFNIPALATGAVIPPNREFLAVLGDQRSGTNIETPLPTMIQAFKQAWKEIGVTGGNQTVVLEVDGRELGRVVVKFGGAEYQRIGTRLTEAHA